MSVSSKLHYKALTDLVEVMSILSTIAIGVDLYWSISDFINQDNPGRLVPVLFFLSFALVGMSAAIMKYHMKLFRQLASEMRLTKVLAKHVKEPT